MANRNYFAHGGKELVIGGKLTFLPGAVVEGVDGLLDVETEMALEYDAPSVPDSEATTVTALREDYNHLLATLRTTGVLAGPSETKLTSEATHAVDA